MSLDGRESYVSDWSSPSSRYHTEGDNSPRWSPDSINHCEMCLKDFSSFRRRHHCRKCGALVCYKCSRHSLVIPRISNKSKRVCDSCYNGVMSNPVADIQESIAEAALRESIAARTLRVAVNSFSQVKVQAVVQGISRAITGTPLGQEVDVQCFEHSGHKKQCFGDEDTLARAIDHAHSAYANYQNAFSQPPNFSVGFECGVTAHESYLDCYSWVVIYDGHREGTSRTASYILPPAVSALVLSGFSVKEAHNIVFSEDTNSKLGTIGRLTRGKVPMALHLESSVTFAFLPFEWKDLYDTIDL